MCKTMAASWQTNRHPTLSFFGERSTAWLASGLAVCAVVVLLLLLMCNTLAAS
jgi:hypothetical protein